MRLLMLSLLVGAVGCSSASKPAAEPRRPMPPVTNGCTEGRIEPCPCAEGKGFRLCKAGTLGPCVCRLSARAPDVTREVRPPRREDLAGYLRDLGGSELWARIVTSHGTIQCQLFKRRAPLAVANFVGLARGLKAWKHPTTGEVSRKRYYDGLTFHRVIPRFMIQGGDPLGTGRGGPGYQFGLELDPSLSFERPGRLAMANAGPGTNGSQFFITEVAARWLDGKHTIFGECQDMGVIMSIARAPVANARPMPPVTITEIRFAGGRR